MFGRYGYREVEIVDQPLLPLPSGGAGNGTTYVTNKQSVTGFTWVPSGTSLLEGRFGWSRTAGGKNPPALGSPDAFAEPTASPACRPIRAWRAACRRS